MISVNISLHSNPRGRGIWKLNVSSLSEIDYVNQINAQIKEVQEEYQGENSINPALMWEITKLKIKEKSMAYTVRKKRSVLRKEEKIEQIIAPLEKKIENHLTSEEEKKDLQWNLKRESWEKIIEYRTQGTIKRAKVRWYNEGEKNTNYFLNLVKRHCKQQAITALSLPLTKR